jgi:hypothetical protein
MDLDTDTGLCADRLVVRRDIIKALPNSSLAFMASRNPQSRHPFELEKRPGGNHAVRPFVSVAT